MQVSVVKVAGLERRLNVELPWATFEEHKNTTAKKLQRTAKIPGFRPGKAPLDVVLRHTPDLSQRVISDLMYTSFEPALKQINEDDTQKLRLASSPRFEMPALEEGKPVTLAYTFEVYPEIEFKDLTGIDIEKPTAELQEQDIDDTIEKLRQQMRTWKDVNHPAASGDRLILDFEGFVNDEPFEGNKAEHFSLELGSKRMIPGFEDALIGMKPQEERTIDVTFPEDYHATELAGKAAKFKIHLHQIQEPVLPEIDANFVKNFGVEDGTVEGLRKELRQGLSRELETARRNKVKDLVFDKLLEVNQFDVPSAMLEEEIVDMHKKMQKNFGGKLDLALARQLFASTAKRRVMLALLLGEIVKLYSITADPERVKAYIEQRATAFEKPEEIVRMYFGNKELMHQIESVVLEDQIVDLMLEKAHVTVVPSSFSEIMQNQKQ